MFQTLPNQVQNFRLVTWLIQAEIELSTAQTYCPTVYRGTVLCYAAAFLSFFLPLSLLGFRGSYSKENKEKTYPERMYMVVLT